MITHPHLSFLCENPLLHKGQLLYSTLHCSGGPNIHRSGSFSLVTFQISITNGKKYSPETNKNKNWIVTDSLNGFNLFKLVHPFTGHLCTLLLSSRMSRMISTGITFGSGTMTHFEVLASNSAFPKNQMLLGVPGFYRLKQTEAVFLKTKAIFKRSSFVFLSCCKNYLCNYLAFNMDLSKKKKC